MVDREGPVVNPPQPVPLWEVGSWATSADRDLDVAGLLGFMDGA